MMPHITVFSTNQQGVKQSFKQPFAWVTAVLCFIATCMVEAIESCGIDSKPLFSPISPMTSSPSPSPISIYISPSYHLPVPPPKHIR